MNTIQDQINKILRMTKGMIIFRAIVMLAIGVAMFFAPLPTLWWMTIVIGGIVMADGIILLSNAIQSDDELRSVTIINAILMIILGIFSLSAPLLMDMIWVMLLGIWQFLAGLQYLFLRRRARPTLFSLTNGVLSILAGLFFMFLPFGGLLAATWLIAIVLIVSSIMNFITAFKL